MLIKERLENIVKEINSTLKGSYLNRIDCLNEYDYIFRFSHNKANSLFISLNVKNPFVAMIKNRYNFSSTSYFYQKLKTKIMNSCLINASIVNEDNILKLDFLKTTDTYDRIEYSLIFEIFKSNANLILLNEGKIDDAFRFKGIDTHHPIMKNMVYMPPEKSPFDREVKQKDLDNEINYLNNLERTYLDNKYKSVKLDVKRRIKSLTKKIDKIKLDQEEAIKKLEYKEYGDHFLTILDEVKRGDSSFDYYGKSIKINETFSPTENLNLLYKTYKKAKMTIESTKDYIVKTEDEIDYLNNIYSSFDYLNDDDYQELIPLLIEKKYIKFKGQKKQKNVKNATKPYYITHNNVRIGFGKNSIQNAELTFKYANKDDYFIHIKNTHGNHVIIFDNNPSDEIIDFALQFTIFLSGKTDGELIFAKVKTLKKGNQIGLVKLGPYESYTIKNLTYNFKDLIKEANRF